MTASVQRSAKPCMLQRLRSHKRLLLISALFCVSLGTAFHHGSLVPLFVTVRQSISNSKPFHQPPDPARLKPHDFLPSLPSHALAFHGCLLGILNSTSSSSKLFDTLPPGSAQCFRKHLEGPKSLGFMHLRNKDDAKQVIMPRRDSANCTVLTLGVGGDIDAEEQLKARIPTCRFVGADPSREHGAIFQSLPGAFHQLAIGVGQEIGPVNLFVRAEGRHRGRFTVYERRQLPLYDFVHFVERKAKLDFIDHLWMDSEGSEYSIFRSYFLHGFLRQRGVTICQMSVEFHRDGDGGTEAYGLSQSDAGQLFAALVREAEWLPLWGESQGHASLYLFNFRSRMCLSKYLGWV